MSSKKCIWDVFLLVNDIKDLARGRAAPNPLILKGFWQGAKELNPVSQGWSLLCCRNTYPLLSLTTVFFKTLPFVFIFRATTSALTYRGSLFVLNSR